MGEAVGDGDGLGEGDGLGLGEGDGLGLGEGDGLGLGEGAGLGLGEGDGLGLGEGEGLGLGDSAGPSTTGVLSPVSGRTGGGVGRTSTSVPPPGMTRLVSINSPSVFAVSCN